MLGLLIAFLVYSFEAVNFPPKNVLILAISHSFLDFFGGGRGLFVLRKILQAMTIALVTCYCWCSFPPLPSHPPYSFVKVYAVFIYNKLHIRKCIIWYFLTCECKGHDHSHHPHSISSCPFVIRFSPFPYPQAATDLPLHFLMFSFYHSVKNIF